MSWDEEPYLLLSGRFEEIEFIGGSTMVLGVPFDAPEEFKRKVWAAAQCYATGNRSMDYFCKRYGDYANFPRPSAARRKLCSILRLAGYEVDRIVGQLSNGVERDSILGLFAAECALIRLSVSFKYGTFLLMQGATYESAAVLRLAMEQIAWAFDVHKIDDESLFQKNPTKSISKIKEIDVTSGRLYSLLSDYTHIQPALQRNYLDFSGEYAAVLYYDYDAALKLSDLYVQVVDLYTLVSEKIAYKYFNTLQAWSLSEDGELLRVPSYSCVRRHENDNEHDVSKGD